jgi:FKBP-type peptidyl-prolyl cis-trans isomerase 2
LAHLGPQKYEASFENGKGIISVAVPAGNISEWNKKRADFAQKIFELHPSLDTLEFREEYGNVFYDMELGEEDVEVNDAIESGEIKAGDFITINFVERCDGEVLQTNIKQIAIDNDLYDEYSEYVPDVRIISLEHLAKSLHDEFIGKRIGAKGTVIISHEEVYGKRSDALVHSIDQKEISPGAEIGSCIHHPKYGDGVVIKKFGKRIVVDFNHVLAEKDIECEYEIVEKITDPTQQFYRLLAHLGPQKYEASFENGKGTINLEVPLIIIEPWGVLKAKLALDLFEELPFLKTLEFREKYEYDIDEEAINAFEDKDFLKASLQRIIEVFRKKF